MLIIAAFMRATLLVIAGYFVWYASSKAEDRLRTVGKYIAMWTFAFAAVLVVMGIAGAVMRPMNGRMHGDRMHGGMHGMHGHHHMMGAHPGMGGRMGPGMAIGMHRGFGRFGGMFHHRGEHPADGKDQAAPATTPAPAATPAKP